MPLLPFFIFLGTGAMFLVLGYLIGVKKKLGLLSNYNMKDLEMRKHVDEDGLAKFVGGCMTLVGIIMVLGGILNALGIANAIIGSVFVMLVVVSVMAMGVYKFDDRKTKVPISGYLILGLNVVVIIFVGSMIYATSLDVEVEIDSQSVNIKGFYGYEVDMDEIEDIRLLDTIPKIITKTNGASTDNVKKGHFKLESLGHGRLYINKNSSPYILITLKDSYILLNNKKPENTQELYQEITRNWR